MSYSYYKLPFGAQLLIWTTRVTIHGSCRTVPNKYELIEMAYKKVGIRNGNILLKNFLTPLSKNPLFNIQPLCKSNLTNSEFNLIKCIHEHKKKDFDNNYFIELWSLENYKDTFTLNCKNLANAFTKAYLVTDLQAEVFKKRITQNFTFNTIH